MKWIALALFLFAAPVIAAWLRTQPRRAPLIWGLLTFLPFVTDPWHLIVSPMATPTWSGYVKGWQFSLLDAVALGVIFGTRARWFQPALVFPFVAYLLAALLAVWQARFPDLALSYPIQLARVGLVFVAVAKVVTDERGERAVLTGLALGLALQAGYALMARAGGALQTGGSLGHQNLLGYVSHMAFMPVFAMLLVGKGRVAIVGVLAGAIIVVLGASRATIVIAAAGIVATLLLSLSLRFSSRKALIALSCALLAAAIVPIMQATMERRLAAQGINFLSADKQRQAFERAARGIMAAKPMGIGPNHYVFVANTEGYNAKAGVNWSFGNRSASVHNSYLMVGAETGWLGLVTMVLLLGSAIATAFLTAWKHRRHPSADILIGVGCGLLAIAAHGFVEWMFVISPAQYLFASSLGLIAGLRIRLANRAAQARRRPERATRYADNFGPLPAGVSTMAS